MPSDQAAASAISLRLPRLASARRLPWVPIVTIGVFVFVGLLAPLLTARSPYATSLLDRLLPPSPTHLLGTDAVGRDVLARIMYGARVSLIVAAVALSIGGGVGLILGIVSGYFGGKIDSVLMRIVDGALAIPPIFIALLLAVTLGPGLLTVIVAIAAVLWSRFPRIIRAEVLTLVEKDFIAQATVNGCSSLRIMATHILPNVLNTFIVLVSLNVGWVITVEATLSFLGAGVPPPTPSWGQIVSDGKTYITSAWWISFFGGLVILLPVLAFNLLGDWLRDALDPKLRQL